MALTTTPELTNFVQDLTNKSSTQSQKTQEDIITFGEDLNTFLDILTTQLQNQDPTEPMDAQEFTKQLVQFAGIEKQIQTNQKMDDLIAINEQSQVSYALGFLGKNVEFASSYLNVEDSHGEFLFDLEENADRVKIEIYTGDGTVVYNEELENLSAGGHGATWDGLGNNNVQQDDGVYSLRVTAYNEDNDSIATEIRSIGRVDQVVPGEEGTFLTIGPLQIDPTRVISVRPGNEVVAEDTPDA